MHAESYKALGYLHQRINEKKSLGVYDLAVINAAMKEILSLRDTVAFYEAIIEKPPTPELTPEARNE